MWAASRFRVYAGLISRVMITMIRPLVARYVVLRAKHFGHVEAKAS